ncbi:alanine racemase [Mammaliicoccus stepanovicii]|uniref:Pyridoxal-dependent decarboxylase n=1 Tax=Mammaliicoccus stepanovicii TaxID=643214 RepID=A0A239Y698_9STAP|nr:alanine racemase [Mammaliicoccus stepanovicii]PNZ77222.1 pyridoxal-dependent decarboxylase, pyridoxal-binding domain protein [Mammaliicoccus stepanovicii]GGI43241.1 diaminopimelate decarboxylase [Mammaliicoccus stepanovicii]SNV54699.1 pyridoxal-dependent decarboxylase [Mammaliicoccus stepanovicii]
MERIKQTLQDSNYDYYVYDLTELQNRLSWITSVTKHDIYYAVKANSNLKILETVAPYVSGFEVASPGEIEKVRSISKDINIIYGGPVKTTKNLEYALNEHVKSIQVESLYELDSLESLLRNSGQSIEVMIRINLSNIKSTAKLKMAGVPTQFGMPKEDIEEAIQICKDTDNITLTGFHFHSMSNNLDEDAHVAFIERAIEFTNLYQSELPENYSINVGGGIGIDYSEEKIFDFDYFATRIHHLPHLTFELGRFITSPIGYYAANVFDIKTIHQETFILLNGGTNHFRFPKAWNHNQPYEIITCEPSPNRRIKSVSDETVVFAGKLCTPNDVFGQPYNIKHIQTGDWIVFKYAGSYGFDISHLQFLSHELPIIKYI